MPSGRRGPGNPMRRWGGVRPTPPRLRVGPRGRATESRPSRTGRVRGRFAVGQRQVPGARRGRADASGCPGDGWGQAAYSGYPKNGRVHANDSGYPKHGRGRADSSGYPKNGRGHPGQGPVGTRVCTARSPRGRIRRLGSDVSPGNRRAAPSVGARLLPGPGSPALASHPWRGGPPWCGCRTSAAGHSSTVSLNPLSSPVFSSGLPSGVRT